MDMPVDRAFVAAVRTFRGAGLLADERAGWSMMSASRWVVPFPSVRTVRLVAMLLVMAILGGCAASTPFKQWRGGVPVHIVAPGDTLYSIAVANDLDWRSLARWNGIRNPRSLRIGQVLRLAPGKRRARSTAARAVPAHHNTRAVRHKSVSRSAHHHTAAPVHHHGAITWHWPVSGKVLSRFKAGDPAHKGIVLGGKLGEPIRASAPGEVVYAGNGLPGYGNLIIVKHDQHMLTAYAYNQRLLVKEGQRVKSGQSIATMGHQPGRAHQGQARLLFQIRRNGKPVDPLHYLSSR